MDRISIAALRTLTTALLDHLEETDGSGATIEHDSFRWIPPDDADGFDAAPR